MTAELEAWWNRALSKVSGIEEWIAAHDAAIPRREVDPSHFAELAYPAPTPA